MATVGPKRERRIPQAPKILYGLPIGGPVEVGPLQDGLLKLGIRNLTLGKSGTATKRAKE
jgi:hypothetical protein